MAELQHSQIRAKLLEDVAPFIDVADIKGKPAADLETHLLSRCVATTALKIVGDVPLPTASQGLVDGGGDNGIDLIHYEQQTRTLFLVQSKWSSSHSSSIASGEVL